MTPPPPDNAELAAIEEQAVRHVRRVAHELVAPSFGGSPSDHSWASHTQVHTVDDAVAGAALAELFQDSFPEHDLVIEDRPTVRRDGATREWLIDPIDGSANHLRGIPYVAVSAGLREGGVPIVGVVHDLLRDVTLSAHTGGGVRRRDAHGDISSAEVSGTTTLADTMLIAHISRRGPLLGIEGALQRVLWHVRKIRCMGSIALDLALLASGEADLLVVGRGTPQRMLDIAGGLVVLQEAGGVVMTANGTPVDETTRTLIAGPAVLCEQFVALMADDDLEGWSSDRAQPPPGAAR